MLPHDVALLQSDDHLKDDEVAEDSLLRFRSSLLNLYKMDKGLGNGSIPLLPPLRSHRQEHNEDHSFVGTCTLENESSSILLRGVSHPQIS